MGSPHGEHTDPLRALHSWALEHRARWPTDAAFDRVMRLTFASATKTLGAVSILTEQGYGADALRLCRSLLESLLVAYWSVYVADHDWVVERIDEHQEFTSLVWAELAPLYPGWFPDGDPGEPPERAVQDRARLRVQYGEHGEQSWWAIDVEQNERGRWKRTTTRTLRTLVEDLIDVPQLEGRLWDAHDGEGAPTPFVRALLDIPNRFNNQVLHHNPAGLSSYAKPGPGGLVIDDEPSDKWVPQAEVLAYVAFSLLCKLMIDVYASDLADSFDELDSTLVSGFVTLSPDQLAAARDGAKRNSPCPCGSGLKAKRCHGRR
jgi:hypothetical protein